MPLTSSEKLGQTSPRTREIADCDPLAWLAAREGPERFYWRGRNGDEFAAVGSVARPPSLEAAQLFLESPGVIVLGAMNFDSAAKPWPGFSEFGFRVPLRLLCKTATSTRLHLFDREDDFTDESAAKEIAGLNSTTFTRTDEPNESGWSERVSDALDRIDRGEFIKVVPARRTSLQFSEAPDAFQLLLALKKITPGCSHFLVEGNGGFWIGASPEMLYSRHGHDLRTEAVAGTRPRGATSSEDEELGKFLLQDLKESEEHAAVVGMIRDVLEKFADHIDPVGPRHLLKLARVQHLITEFSALIRDRVGDADLLRALHPTPATCGLHVVAAREWLRQNESFSRGYYAGPVGWMSREQSGFAVGLRSGFLHDRTLDLYAGAGVVRGSRPEREWKELNSKIGDWLSLFEEGGAK